MSKFKLDYSTATLQRLSYTTDSNWNKKATYWASEITAKWYLSPVSTNNQEVWLDRFWQMWNFECDYPFDVKESDLLSIDWTEYQVKSYARVKGINIDRVRVVLVLPKNEW